MTRIHNKFEELKEKGKAALVTYLTAGDPSLEATPDIFYKLEESGADIIELGVPFSDPMADGPTIQLASERALKNGTTVKGVLNIVSKIRKRSEIPIISFGYYNPFLSYGLRRFSEDARNAGVDGVLVVDLPPEEADEFKNHTRLPVGIGFGVSTPDQAARIANFADAVIVGSALIRIIEKYGNNGKELFKEISGFISGLSKACYRDS